MRNLTLTLFVGMLLASVSLNAQLVDWNPVSKMFDANPSFPSAYRDDLGDEIKGLGFEFIGVDGDEAIEVGENDKSLLWLTNATWTNDTWLTYPATGLTVGDEYEIVAVITGSNGWANIKINLDGWETSGAPDAIYNTDNYKASSSDAEPSAQSPLTIKDTVTVTNESMTFGFGVSTNGGWTYFSGFSINKVGGSVSDKNDITTFSLTEQTGSATIDAVAHTVAIEVKNGTDLSSLSPTVVISANATISPDPSTVTDYSSSVDFKVKAEDNTEETWTVTVTEAPVSVINEAANIVNVYPNPSNGVINIDLVEEAVVSVINIAGEVIFSNSVSGSVTLSDLEAGMYIIKVNDESVKVVVK